MTGREESCASPSSSLTEVAISFDAGLPPFQGEHNREILTALGLSDADIADLEAAGMLISAVPETH